MQTSKANRSNAISMAPPFACADKAINLTVEALPGIGHSALLIGANDATSLAVQLDTPCRTRIAATGFVASQQKLICRAIRAQSVWEA